MRADVVWPTVWGVCFVGGVIFGSSTDNSDLSSSRQGSNLRGGDRDSTMVPVSTTLKDSLGAYDKGTVRKSSDVPRKNENTGKSDKSDLLPPRKEHQYAEGNRALLDGTKKARNVDGSAITTTVATTTTSTPAIAAAATAVELRAEGNFEPIHWSQAAGSGGVGGAGGGGLWGPSDEESREMLERKQDVLHIRDWKWESRAAETGEDFLDEYMDIAYAKAYAETTLTTTTDYEDWINAIEVWQENYSYSYNFDFLFD